MSKELETLYKLKEYCMQIAKSSNFPYTQLEEDYFEELQAALMRKERLEQLVDGLIIENKEKTRKIRKQFFIVRGLYNNKKEGSKKNE